MPNVYFCAAAAFCAYSRCVLRMLHHSLCSAMGIPHSTHTRIRCPGWGFRENNFRHKVKGIFPLRADRTRGAAHRAP